MENQSSPELKQEALKAMEKLRGLYPMPSDIEYDKEREIALESEGNLAEFWGTMDLGEGLEVQKMWRDEWGGK